MLVKLFKFKEPRPIKTKMIERLILNVNTVLNIQPDLRN